MRFDTVCKYCDYHILNYNGVQYKCTKCNKRSKNALERELKPNEYYILNDKITLTTKHEIFNLLFINNKMKILNISLEKIDVKKTLKKFKIFNEYKHLTLEELILFLLEKDNICINKKCNNKTVFRRVGKINVENSKDNSHDLFCSKKCLHSYRSKNMINDNSVHKIKDRVSWKKNMSIGTLKSIENGTCTPNITNSWTHFETKIKGKSYRSTWDAFFHIVNNDLEYETIRLPYYFDGKKHIYIVDFVNKKDKILYEIKPDSERKNERNILKEKVAIEWCIVNGYNYKIITNEWFEKNYPLNKHLLNDYPSIQEKLKQFE